MAEEEISLFKFAMKYGAIGGAVSIVATLVLFVLDMSMSPIGQYLMYVLILVIILWGQWEYKKAEKMPISYGETFGLGMLIVLYYTVITVVYAMIHWSFIDTGLTEKSLMAAEQALRAQQLPEDQMAQALEAQKMFVGPVVTPLFAGVFTLVLGLILSLITSIFMRRAGELKAD